jgi:predicted Zn-dependent protease
MDERVTISTDPMDPELKYPPFALNMSMLGTPFDMLRPPVYHAATWIKNGILNEMAYDLKLGEELLGKSTGLPNKGAFRMSGGTTSVDEMIQTTKRGLLVTRFDGVTEVNGSSVLYRGYTRDGFWLIEDGKISKSVKNMVFTESPMFVLNSIDQLGVPQRVFNAGRTQDELYWWAEEVLAPIIVPPLKVRDFSFTALTDAV